MHLVGVAVVDGGGGHQRDPGVAVLVVVPVHERAAVPACVLDRVEPGGERGPVLQRLEVRLGVRVSLEVYGREWVFETPRSSSSSLTCLERIGAPRSACRMLGVIGCWPTACSISALASSAVSRCRTVQPTM